MAQGLPLDLAIIHTDHSGTPLDPCQPIQAWAADITFVEAEQSGLYLATLTGKV